MLYFCSGMMYELHSSGHQLIMEPPTLQCKYH